MELREELVKGRDSLAEAEKVDAKGEDKVEAEVEAEVEEDDEDDDEEEDTEESADADTSAPEQRSPSYLYSRVKSALFGGQVQTKMDKYIKPKSSGTKKKRTPSQTPPNDKQHKKLRDDIVSEGGQSPFTIISQVNEHIHHPPEVKS